MNELMSDEGVCRTAPATPGLVNMHYIELTVILTFQEPENTFSSSFLSQEYRSRELFVDFEIELIVIKTNTTVYFILYSK